MYRRKGNFDEKKIGPALKRLRKGKGYRPNRFYHDICSESQLYRSECSETMLSSDKLLKILTRLNTNSNEFMLLTNYMYARSKIETEKQLYTAMKHQNLTALQQVAQSAEDYHLQYGGCYFNHTKSIARALLSSAENIEVAREYLQPILDHLFSAKTWFFYEVQLTLRCLPMLELDLAIRYGNKALQAIQDNSLLYYNTGMAGALFMKLSIYLLDYPEHVTQALEYAKELEKSAATDRCASQMTYAKVIQQICHFKLKNDEFDENHLHALINTFKLIGLDHDWQYAQTLMDKNIL